MESKRNAPPPPGWLETLWRDGAVVLQDRLTPAELSGLDVASRHMIDRWRDGLVEDEDYWTCKGPGDVEVLYRIHNFETKWPGLLSFLRLPAIQDILGGLFADEARPTVMALCIKLPQVGAPVPWHRDPVDAPAGTVLNLSIYLDDSSPTNGCLEFVPGSHLDPERAPLEHLSTLLPAPTARGGVVIHDVNVLHGSHHNPSEHLRRALVVEFRRAKQAFVDASESRK